MNQAEHTADRLEMYQEAEVVEHQELEPYRGEVAPSNLFGVSDPVQVIEQAEKVASALKSVIDQKNLTVNIQGKDHVLVAGWTLLGSMLGVFPVCVWSRKLENGWEARVEARTRSGDVIGAAEAMCTREERWGKGKDEYAIRSMAQTRATSKAMRQPLGFVVTLAGYAETPAEEMPTGAAGPAVPASPPPSPPPAKMASKATMAKIAKLIAKLEASQPTAGTSSESWADAMRAHVGGKHGEPMTVDQAGKAIAFLGNADIPFG